MSNGRDRSRRLVFLPFVVAVIVSVLGYLLDRLLVREGLSRPMMLMISNSITGVVAGGLLFQLVRYERAERAFLKERMHTVAELNHHIRNALQVIKFWGGGYAEGPQGMQVKLINDSVDRIEWALREVLPKLPAEEMDEAQFRRMKSAGPAA